jgi:Glycosyl hydrolase family 26
MKEQYVDVVGVDVYGRGTSLPQLSGYSQLATYGKPFAITEFGACAADTLETPSRCAPADMRPLIASIKANMPKTVYWLQWDRVMSLDYNLNVFEVLNDPWVVTREEIVLPVPSGSVVVPQPPPGMSAEGITDAARRALSSSRPTLVAGSVGEITHNLKNMR